VTSVPSVVEYVAEIDFTAELHGLCKQADPK